MFSTEDDIRSCLELLGQKLAARGLPAASIFICGGSALNLSGMVARTTADVDTLGIKTEDSRLAPIPDWLTRCAREVAGELLIEEDWLNDAAQALLPIGLPDKILDRGMTMHFGEKLEVIIASRPDLIALKCFAALDPKDGERHLEDLVDICPTEVELDFAANWLLNRPTSSEFREAVLKLCSVLGHPQE